jgi:endoglucanase
MAIPPLLRDLLTAPGPSGYETAPAAVWREAASAFAEVSNDALGSSVARVAGTSDGPSLAVLGHIDEIGLMVTHVDDEGFASVLQVGGIRPEVLLGQRVDLHIDVGVRNRAEALELLQIGDVAVIAGEPVELAAGRIASRSLDNRLGAYVALEAARRVAEAGGAPGDVLAVAAVQEEVGDFGGARTSVFSLQPQVVLAVDVTGATDIPDGDPKLDGEAKLGAGPILNRGSTISPKVFDLLVAAAEAEGIPYAVNVSAGETHTDMDAAYASRAGIAAGLISLATRYIHTPTEIVSLDDVEATVRLVAAFAGRLEPGLDFTR